MECSEVKTRQNSWLLRIGCISTLDCQLISDSFCNLQIGCRQFGGISQGVNFAGRDFPHSEGTRTFTPFIGARSKGVFSFYFNWKFPKAVWNEELECLPKGLTEYIKGIVVAWERPGRLISSSCRMCFAVAWEPNAVNHFVICHEHGWVRSPFSLEQQMV